MRAMKRLLSALCALALVSLGACDSSETGQEPTADSATASDSRQLRVSGSYWIELSPVVVAANRFYSEQLDVGEGGITRITAGEADVATNAETQLLRESLNNPDLRIIMTVTSRRTKISRNRNAGGPARQKHHAAAQNVR
jgi:hypothetical protein